MPVAADITIKTGDEIFKEYTNKSAVEVRLPINASYEVTVRKDKFLPQTITYNLSEFEDYHKTEDIFLEPRKIDYRIQVGGAFTNRENVRVILKNKLWNEQIDVGPSNDQGEYVVKLREDQTYELDVKDYTSSFFYAENIRAIPGNDNQSYINSDKLQSFGKKIDYVASFKKDSLLSINNTLNEELNALKEELAAKERDTVRVEELADTAASIIVDTSGAEFSRNTVKVSETGETIEVDENDPLVKLDQARKDVIEQQKVLIAKNEAVKENLNTILNNLEQKGLSDARKDSLQRLAKLLEEEILENDRLYEQLRKDNVELLNKINYRLNGLTWEYFYKKYFWVIVVLGIALVFLLVGNGIFYRIAMIRRQQRDQQALFNEEIRQQKEEIETQRDNLKELNQSLADERKKSDDLLLNILPPRVAEELKVNGHAKMRTYKRVSILFTDFKGFTDVASKMTPDKLMEELNDCFTAFDGIINRFKMEKIKTIGDAYMCAGGIPDANGTNPIDVVLAGLEMQEFMQRRRKEKLLDGDEYWQCRLGINTGEIRAGVIGTSKFAYDIWGNPVNIASRMESGGAVNRVNISGETYELVKDFFECDYRGEVEVKNGLILKMYFVNRIKPELSRDKRGIKPNKKFEKMVQEQFDHSQDA